MNYLIANEFSDIVQTYVSRDDVFDGRSWVKLGKKDGYGLIFSDHFIYINNRLYILLAMLFNCMVIHGYSADGMNMFTVQALAKNEGIIFRAVALSSLMAKIFDWILWNKNLYNVSTSDL